MSGMSDSRRIDPEAKALRWKWDKDAEPARVYTSTDGRFEILWDPAGRTEDEDGGWWLSEGDRFLGIFKTLKVAKERAANA